MAFLDFLVQDDSCPKTIYIRVNTDHIISIEETLNESPYSVSVLRLSNNISYTLIGNFFDVCDDIDNALAIANGSKLKTE